MRKKLLKQELWTKTEASLENILNIINSKKSVYIELARWTTVTVRR